MPTPTHCHPTGVLGPHELDVPPVPGYGISTFVPSGHKRGVVVFLHGLTGPGATFPLPVQDFTGPILPSYLLTLCNDLKSDGWIVISPIYAEDGYVTGNATEGVWQDLNADAGHGSRYLAQVLRWWDHVVDYCTATYRTAAGLPRPIVPFGPSWGGFHAIQIAANRSGTIAAYGAHVPAMSLAAINPIFTPGFNFNQSPVSVGISGTPTLPASTMPTTASPITAGFAPSGSFVIYSGTIWEQLIAYTGLTSSSFTGCTGGRATTLPSGCTAQQTMFSSGLDIPLTALNPGAGNVLATIPGIIGWETGDTVVGYGLTQALYNAAQTAGANVTSYAVGTPSSPAGEHQISLADAQEYSNFSGGTGWFQTTVDPLCPLVA